MRLIPYGRQDISEEDIQAVTRVLKSDWLTQGPAVEEFEHTIAAYCGAKHAVAVSSATQALHLACRALGLGPGDRLWTSPNSFVASANCALYCGAEVDFVDIDSRTYCMSVPSLAAKLDAARKRGELPKIIVPVHFAGQSCAMEQIAALSREYGFSTIEDASHAVGADYQGRKVGDCRYADICIFSLHPVKIVTTGEGGVLLTNRDDLRESMALLRTHGITRDRCRMQNGEEGGWYYEQLDLGYNYRITDIQAALGSSQLKRLDIFIARRRELAARYDELLQGLNVVIPFQDPATRSSWHLYVIQMREPSQRRTVFDRLRKAGVLVNVHYIPIHLHPYYRAMGFRPGDFPEAEKYYRAAITLPLFYGLKDAEQDFVVETLRDAVA
jgi:UDP-4-amino-4,6-dideoxy-N-acetyl-beta-L-altrosamine transaminase